MHHFARVNEVGVPRAEPISVGVDHRPPERSDLVVACGPPQLLVEVDLTDLPQMVTRLHDDRRGGRYRTPPDRHESHLAGRLGQGNRADR